MRDEEIIESINDGYIYFWSNPKNKWRNNIYEASKIETKIENQHEVEVAESLRRSQENLLREFGMLRDMPAAKTTRPPSQSRTIWIEP